MTILLLLWRYIRSISVRAEYTSCVVLWLLGHIYAFLASCTVGTAQADHWDHWSSTWQLWHLLLQQTRGLPGLLKGDHSISSIKLVMFGILYNIITNMFGIIVNFCRRLLWKACMTFLSHRSSMVVLNYTTELQGQLDPREAALFYPLPTVS